MKVVYKAPIIDQIHEAVKEASRIKKSIEHISMSRDEYNQLLLESPFSIDNFSKMQIDNGIGNSFTMTMFGVDIIVEDNEYD